MIIIRITNLQTMTLKYCFMIDSTGSMKESIQAAYEECINLAEDAKRISGMNVEFSVICFRDPVDKPGDDVHDFIKFTDDIDDVKRFLGTQKAKGGGDGPEDWVGAFDIMFNKLNWGSECDTKCLTIIADAPPHGTVFANQDKYPDEGPKLIEHIKTLVNRKISVKLMSINRYGTQAMEIFKQFYTSFGGEVCDLKEIGIKNLPKGTDIVRTISNSIRQCSNDLVTHSVRIRVPKCDREEVVKVDEPTKHKSSDDEDVDEVIPELLVETTVERKFDGLNGRYGIKRKKPIDPSVDVKVTPTDDVKVTPTDECASPDLYKSIDPLSSPANVDA